MIHTNSRYYLHACPCGYAGDVSQECTCTPVDIRRYIKKISGPLLDRIDIYVHVPRLDYAELTAKAPAEPSAAIRERVLAARAVQQKRLARYGLHANAQMGHKHLRSACAVTGDAELLLKQAFTQMNLSARGYDRILKVARTIADLAGAEQISTPHLAEAIQLRSSLNLGV